MLSAAVSDHSTLAVIVLGAAYVLNRLLRWQERRSMIKKAPASHMVSLAQAFNAPTFTRPDANQNEAMPPAD